MGSRAFSLPEVLVALAIIAVLAGTAAVAWEGAMRQADRADAVAKIRLMGTAVLQYAGDHGGTLPPLFPGQVLEYEEGRGGRIVTECVSYLGLPSRAGRYLAEGLMPRAYDRVRQPADPATMRVYVMNSPMTNGTETLTPFGRVVTSGQPPVGAVSLARVAARPVAWMMSTADRGHPNVAAAPWKASAPADPPLGDVRAVFRFDGTGRLEKISGP
jgi:prepilin-type N-terminal cleavage/methylation domain-containing protein